MTYNLIPVGTRVRANNNAGVPYRGQEGVVTEHRGTPPSAMLVAFDNAGQGGMTVGHDGNGGGWNVEALDVVAPATLAKPVIDFSTDSRATAREYARHLISRCHDKPKTNEVLKAIGNGATDVDPYDVIDILPDVFTGVTTRLGNSIARREQASKVRHLAYIANAVVRNHGEGLPPVEAGTRSPRIKALEEQVENLRHGIDLGTQEVEATTARLTEVQDALAGALSRADEAERNTREVSDVLAERAAILARLQTGHERLKATLDYALTLLDDASKFKVVGYSDRVNEGH